MSFLRTVLFQNTIIMFKFTLFSHSNKKKPPIPLSI